MTAPLRIHLLGPCQVFWQGRPLDLPRRQARALLYRLAASPEPASRAGLAFLFWPDVPDADARRQLTRLLSGLRAALPAPDLLLVSEEAATLDPARIWVDSRQLLRAAATDDPADLEALAALVRGPFMAGFSLPGASEYEAWQTGMAIDLETRALGVLERLVAIHSARNDLSAAGRFARQFLAVDPLSEVMHRALISLHVRAGDRAAARRQYEQCALMLERELGVSPLPETRAALLVTEAAGPALHLPVLPTLDIPMIGRGAALARLEEACRRRDTTVVLVAGEPGIGKTRLIRESSLREAGRRLVLTGSSYSQSLPFHPLLQALRSCLDRRQLWEAVPAIWLSELLPLLPELRTLFPDLPGPVPAPPEQTRPRLLAALTETLSSFPAGALPLLLCLDDLQSADEDTLAWLQFLAARRRESAAIIVLAACHSLDAAALAPMRSDLVRARRLVEIGLDGLPRDAIRDLLVAAAPDSPMTSELADRVHAVSGGNPFFALEIVHELQESGRIDDPPPDLPLPATVRDAILSRTRRLSPVARQLLEAAAVLGPQLEEPMLQLTSARSAAETADALDELVAHQLLSPDLSFQHNLVSLAVYRDLSPWRRRLLHRRAAESLARHRPRDAATLAHHHAEGGESLRAIAGYRRAAEQAAGLAAYDTALELINRALGLLDPLDDPGPIRLDLLRLRLALHRLLVRLDGWEADIREVSGLAAALESPEARLDALEASISLHVLQSDFDRIEETAAQALALARDLGDRAAEARILHYLGWHLADALGRSREGLVVLEQACSLADDAGEALVLYQARCSLAFALRAEGRCNDARTTALQALSLTGYAHGTAPRPEFADALREWAEAEAYLANWEEARRLLLPLLDLYQTLNDPWNYGAVLHNFGLYCSNMGQHRDAVESMRRLVELSQAVGLPANSDYGIWHRSGLARAQLAAGLVAEAGQTLSELDSSRLTPGRPYLAWARAAGEHRLASGDAPGALEILRPAAAWWRHSASLHDTDVLLLLAQAELAAGNRAQAEAAADEAALHLETTDMKRHRLRLLWTLVQTIGSHEIRVAAREELDVQSARFTDPELRRAFLEDVPLHRSLAER